MNTNKPTELKTMTELKATSLVVMDNGDYHSQASITLKEKHKWFLSSEFQELKNSVKKNAPPQNGAI